MSKTYALDNGAATIKFGHVNSKKPRIVPNCIVKAKSERKRIYIGEEMAECKDRSGLFYLLPFEKGYLVKWDIEQQIWDGVFACEGMDARDSRLLVSDANLLVPAVKDAMDEVLFEHYGFNEIARASASGFVARADLLANDQLRCGVVVDSGYSFTHVAAFCAGKLIRKSVVRIDIGGKALTNQLKEWVSYRQLNVLEETYVMNQCKEDVCYVAEDFHQHMAMSRLKGSKNGIALEYVLPDFVELQRGYIRRPHTAGAAPQQQQQCLTLNTERFAIPELLFHPTDVGVNEIGVVDAIVHAIAASPAALHARLWKNIMLIGGNTMFEGYISRIENELRSMAPDLFTVNVRCVDDPITAAWTSAAKVAASNDLDRLVVSRAEYEEGGDALCRKRFFREQCFSEEMLDRT